MKRTVAGLILVGLLLSLGGTPATAGLLDDLAKKATSTVQGGAPDETDPAPSRRIDMSWLVEHMGTLLPNSCTTGLRTVADYSNTYLSGQAQCWLSYGGPNLKIMGASYAEKNVIYRTKEGTLGKMCSGKPCTEPTSSGIRVELLITGQPLITCYDFEPKQGGAFCSDMSPPGWTIPLGTWLECRATAWGPTASQMNWFGFCETGVPV